MDEAVPAPVELPLRASGRGRVPAVRRCPATRSSIPGRASSARARSSTRTRPGATRRRLHAEGLRRRDRLDLLQAAEARREDSAASVRPAGRCRCARSRSLSAPGPRRSSAAGTPSSTRSARAPSFRSSRRSTRARRTPPPGEWACVCSTQDFFRALRDKVVVNEARGGRHAARDALLDRSARDARHSRTRRRSHPR